MCYGETHRVSCSEEVLMPTLDRMAYPQLIVVTGHSSSGKTTLATALAHELRLPLLSKDTIKEALFDSLGWSDRAWSQRLGAAAITVLTRQLDAFLAVGQSCIIESIFRPDLDGPRLREICACCGFQPITITCSAPGPVLVDRVRARMAAGQRHPGHADTTWLGELEVLLRAGPLPPLDLGGPALIVDTADQAAPTAAMIAAWVRAQRPG
jgi:predicted kinase